jgi:hypothetical protein
MEGGPIRPHLAQTSWARTRPDQERKWLEKIRLWAASKDDCLWLDKVETYLPSRVAGVVTHLRIDPRAGVIEVVITDGRATLGAQWPIDRRVEQLRAAPGVGLVLEGMALIDGRGDLVMVNPVFEIVPGPRQQ